MTDLTVIRTDLPEFSVADVATLSPPQLQQLDLAITDLLAWVKAARTKLDTALVARYGEAARAALLASGRDFGVTHLTDGALRISFELPKKVAWDQPMLAAIAARITANGEKVEDYLSVEFSVSESRWNGWPPVLKEQFVAARTVKAGKPAFRLATVTEE